MILSTLYLKLADRNLPVAYTYGFLKQSRCLCNYLEREVFKKLKFKADGFNRIVVCLTSQPSPESFVNSSQVLTVDVSFTSDEYEAKRGDSLMLYDIDRLVEGLRKCSRSFSIPVEEILLGIEKFKDGGLKNEWLVKSRTFREHSLKASLLGDLTMEVFTLRLKVEHRKQPVLDEVVLQTDPDEIAFEPEFKDIKIEDGCLVITKKYNGPLFARPLISILEQN